MHGGRDSRGGRGSNPRGGVWRALWPGGAPGIDMHLVQRTRRGESVSDGGGQCEHSEIKGQKF